MIETFSFVFSPLVWIHPVKTLKVLIALSLAANVSCVCCFNLKYFLSLLLFPLVTLVIKCTCVSLSFQPLIVLSCAVLTLLFEWF